MVSFSLSRLPRIHSEFGFYLDTLLSECVMLNYMCASGSEAVQLCCVFLDYPFVVSCGMRDLRESKRVFKVNQCGESWYHTGGLGFHFPSFHRLAIGTHNYKTDSPHTSPPPA